MRKGFFARLALQNISKNGKIYYPYMLTSIITVAMLYIICSLSVNNSVGSETVLFTIGLGVWVTTIFSVLFLFYTNSFLMKRRKKEFGLYNILGMEKKHIGRVVAWETLIILAASLAAGFVAGIVLDKLMFMLFMRMIGEISPIRFYISGYAIKFTSIVVSGTFLLILLNSIRQIRTAKPIELLHGGEVGEREPKAKWVLTVLGILTLGTGYYMSVKIVNPVAVIFTFFIAVLLVIAGTYLLFTSGSISLLKLMRRNKRYYYRADHFINVSGMIYRMKQNAVGLGNICILSTMVLVIVFSTVSLWFGIDDTTNQRIPTDITVSIHECEGMEEAGADIADELQKAGFEAENSSIYRYLTFAAYRQGDYYDTNIDGNEDFFGDNIHSLFFVTLEDYNAVYGKSETLEPDEILIASYRSEYDQTSLKVFDMNFRVKGHFDADSRIGNGYVRASIFGTHFIIVNDWETFDRLNALQLEAFGKNASRPMFYAGFNINGSDEEEIAFADVLAERLKPKYSLDSVGCRAELRDDAIHLFGGLLFIGLFLGLLFLMAMILIMYYKQISEGYDDQNRYRIMRKVGLSREETKRTIRSQILTVFFLPLITAGVHIAFAFPSISNMFVALGMTNVTLEAVCALISFVVFAAIYGVVYMLTAKSYYKIISAR